MVGDRSIAKNSTIESYSFDFGDGSEPASGRIGETASVGSALSELKTKTFTHTYTTGGEFSPLLTVKIKENTTEFKFNSPIINPGGLLVSSIEVLEPQDNFITNQPIFTFKIKSQFTNQFNDKNRLTIHVIDEAANESTTELDPTSSEQTISLSEGENKYWFELIDPASGVQKSVERRVVLDTIDPILEIISPSDNQILPDNKLIISGIIDDKYFGSLSYKINNQNEIKEINSQELEDVSEGKKAFEIQLDTQLTPITKVELVAKDKAQNVTSKVVGIESNKIVTLQQQKQNEDIKIVKNDDRITHQIKQGEAFELLGDLVICDDTDLAQNDGQAKLVINSNNFMIQGFPSIINIGGSLLGGGLITSSTIGKLNGCRKYPNVFESLILNNDNTINELFNPSVAGNNPALFWPLGTYAITQSLTSDQNTTNLYGTTFSNNSLSTILTYNIEIIRNVSGIIKKVEPKNLIYNQENITTFKLITEDSIPFTNDKKPLIKTEGSFIQKPSSGIDKNLNLNCDLTPNQILPTRKLEYDCTLKYHSTEYTKEDKPYVLNVPIEFPEENGNKPLFTATSELRADFEIGAKIILPEDFKVIESSTELIKAEADLNKLPEELLEIKDEKTKKLAKYAISLPNSRTNTKIRLIKSGANDAQITRSINSAQNIIEFTTKLNFNLINNETLTKDFKNRDVFGPLYLFSAISSANDNDVRFSLSTPQKLILLDKPRINGGNLKRKINNKTGEETKELTLKITNNSKIPDKYALELVIEPHDLSGNSISSVDNKTIKLKNDDLTKEITIKDLPKETELIKVTLNRSDAFLGEIKGRVNSEFGEIAKNKLDNPIYKIADKAEYKVSGEVLTFCNIVLDNQNILFTYSQKSGKTPGITAEGYLTSSLTNEPSTIPISNIQEIIDPTNRLSGSMSGTISFPLPDEWMNFNKVSFTLTSADESGGCNLELGSKAAFEIGDDNEKTATFNGKSIKVRELKQLLFDLGLITQTDLDKTTYTNEVNQAYWKLTCAIDEAKRLTLDANLRLQTAENPLMCGVAYFEGYPDIKYVEDISSWKEFIVGLKTKVGNDIRAYVNPDTIRTVAVFIALTTFLSPPSWVILVAGFALSSVDLSVRIDEVKKLWNDSGDINYSQTSNWKAGYSVGTLLTAVPNLIPANVGRNIKVAEAASKLDDYKDLQNLLINEQRIINELTDTLVQTQRQDVLNNFAELVHKLTHSGKSVLNQLVQRFSLRNLDHSEIISQFGSLNGDARIALLKINNRDNLTITLNDIEVNDLLFVFAKNVEKQDLSSTVIRVKNNLGSGVPSEVPMRGARAILTSSANEIINGTRTISNPDGVTFFTDAREIAELRGNELLKNLGLDTIRDIDKFQQNEISIIEFDTNGLDLKLPSPITSGINPNFVNGGITSGGEYEAISLGGPLSIASMNSLANVNGTTRSIGSINLTETEIINLLKDSLNPPTAGEISNLIVKLKSEGRL